MKRIRITGLCLIAAFAMSAIATATASAEAPEFGRCLKKAKAEGTGFEDSKCTKPGTGTKAKFEWVPGVVVGKNTFTSKGLAATLETVKGKKVTCETENSTGEYLAGGDNKHETTTVNFTGCKSSGFTCTTEKDATGELTTNPLVGEVAFENSIKTKTALKLEPAPSAEGFFIKFKCVGLGIAVIGNNPEHKGCVPKSETCVGGAGHGILVAIKNDVMATKEILKYKATKGKQVPVKWEGSPKETFLESSFEETAFEQSGQTITSTVENTGGQKYELNRFL